VGEVLPAPSTPAVPSARPTPVPSQVVPFRRRAPTAPPAGVGAALEAVLARYAAGCGGEPFRRGEPLWEALRAVRDQLARLPAVAARPTLRVARPSGGTRPPRLPWVALLDERETRTPRQGVHAALLFRADGSGVSLALLQGAAEPRRQLGARVARATLRQRAADLRAVCRDLPARGFRLDDLLDLRTEDAGTARDYEAAVVAHRTWEADHLPGDEALAADLEALLAACDRIVRARRLRALRPAATALDAPRERRPAPRPAPWEPEVALAALVEAVARRRFVFEPWQVAAYVAALRTKPFVVLAGVSGVGKSRLPVLVAQATGGEARLVPVRPDWTDSAETLGYTDLAGTFRPGAVLQAAADAADHPSRSFVCVLDEMNLARPEHYFAEVLSRMEARAPHPAGGFAAGPLLVSPAAPEEWRAVGLPPNLAVVGTVNMDESAHAFSRKVLDRAFTLELSDAELGRWEAGEDGAGEAPPPARWPARAWYPRAVSLGGLRGLSEAERARVGEAVDAVVAASRLLAPAGLQAGYRTRDEAALFVLHAGEVAGCFADRAGRPVDPLDLALHMKLLPRVSGGSGAVRRAVLGLLGWARGGAPLRGEAEARALLDAWDGAGRPGALPEARFPRTAARLCLMWERFLAEGFTSFWA
jgi:5-methylcytosine-specific restriction enzyme B